MNFVRGALFKKLSLLGVVIIAVTALVYRLKFMPVEVAAGPAAVGEVVDEVMGTGTLEARFQTTISAKIAGRIVELTVDQNDKVTEGQTLARLDDAELRREVTIAAAGLEAARATMERLKAEEARGKAVLGQAQRDYDRYTALVVSKSVSQETLEKSQERLEIAQADLAKNFAAVVEGARQLTGSQERLLFQEARLADTRITAPFDGLIVRRDKEAGDVVAPATSIFQLISMRELWIASWVDESAMARLHVGKPARIVFRSAPKKEFSGKVARIGREVDRETREFKVDVLVSDLPENWAVGQRAEVYIETDRKSGVVVIPPAAIVRRNGKPGVFVVTGGRAQWRDVQLGLQGGGKAEAIRGVDKGDMLVVNADPVRMTDGQRVKIK